MPERRLTLRIETPEEGYNDPVKVEILGAVSISQFEGRAPSGIFEGPSIADALAKVGAAYDAG